MFSRRLPEELSPNAITRALRKRGAAILDLTISNPTACGIPYPPALLSALSSDEGIVYRPDARGLDLARRAVAEEVGRRGCPIDPESLVLTASTSEAYGFLFKLLCDPGDGVLIPRPSYPLFEHLATLEGVRPVPYSLDAGDRWQPCLDEIATEDIRAVIVVHPNNPTGSYVEPEAARRIVGRCAGREVALIADEVFFDYPLATSPDTASFGATTEALTFTLGGLSKSIGLPQLKLAWIAVSGPAESVREAVRRLAFVSDTYLSVATPVQIALPDLLAEGSRIREAILKRCRENLKILRDATAALPALSLVVPHGGWSAVLRFPRVMGEEALVLGLLESEGVAVHPGYFFDFPEEGFLVVSLLPEPEGFEDGVGRLVRYIADLL